MRDHRNTTGTANPANGILDTCPGGGHIGHLPLFQITVEGMLDIPGIAGLDNCARKMRAPRPIRTGQFAGPLPTTRHPGARQPHPDFTAPGAPRGMLAGQPLGQHRAGRGNTQPDDMDVVALPPATEFDASDKIDAGGRRCCLRLSNAVDRVMVGECQQVDATVDSARDHIGRRQRAVRAVGVTVEVGYHRDTIPFPAPRCSPFMKQLFDLFPVIVFVVAYFGYGKDIYLATVAILIASVAQVVLGWLLWRKIDRMHLVTLGVLAVFGGLTIVLHDETFIKWKPSIIDLIFAGTLFVGQFIGKRNLLERIIEGIMKRAAPTSVIKAPPSTWTAVNAAAILFFLGCGALNLYVAYNFDNDTWVNFKVFGLTGLNFLFMIVLIAWLSRHIRDHTGNHAEATDNSSNHPPSA